jgi:polysaccharide export outer membrane protein/exopolysaccharide production protein ExoF
LLHETEVTAPALLTLQQRSERAGPIFKIVRTTPTGTQVLAAQETTPIEPGDTVKVEIPLPESGLAALPAGDNVQTGAVPAQGTD